LGSLSELACLLRLAADLGLLDERDRDHLNQIRKQASQVTWRLYQAMARQARRTS
jgi:hypothetical protein